MPTGTPRKRILAPTQRIGRSRKWTGTASFISKKDAKYIYLQKVIGKSIADPCVCDPVYSLS